MNISICCCDVSEVGDSANEFVVTVGNGLTSTLDITNIKPKCCTLNVYYIKTDTVSEPIPLTPLEQYQVMNYLYQMRLAGMTLRFIPAQVDYRTIDLKLKVTDIQYLETAKTMIEALLKQYELKTATQFVYGEFLVQAANLRVKDDIKGEIKIIDYLLPNQVPYDVTCPVSQYLKFNEIKLSII